MLLFVKFPEKQCVDKGHLWDLVCSLSSHIAKKKPVYGCEIFSGEIRPSSMWMKHFLKSDWGKSYLRSGEQLDRFVVSTYGDYKAIRDVPFLQEHYNAF